MRLCILPFVVALFSGFPAVARGGELLPPETPIAAAIDHYIDARLQEAAVTAAPPCDDATRIRRLTLDLVGRPPTLAEVQAYLADASEEKHRELIQRLLDDAGFVPHQVEQFDTLLMHDSGRSLRAYLERAFAENRPWDQMFRELILADPQAETANGADEFLKARVADIDRLVNDSSVAFFGVNVSCAKCHDHPLVAEWTQDRFFGMKSFFNRTFDSGGFLGEREYGLVTFKTTAGEEKTARLMFLSGTVLDEPASEEPSDEEKKAERKLLEELKKKKQPPPPPAYSRRARLLEVALRPEERPLLARAVVNQLWNRFYGYGLVMPVDQMHPENPPSHPELLDWLSRDLIEHGFDLRRLVEGLVSSRTYARSSRWVGDDPPPARDLFAVGPVKPLAPHQYAAVLRMGSMNPDQFSAEQPLEEVARRLEGLRGAARGLAASFEQPREDFQVSIAEALLLSNNERFAKELLRDAGDSLLGKLKSLDDADQVVETAVWAVLQRSPDDQERELLKSFLADRESGPVEARRQLLWALLTSSECRFNY